MIELPPIARGRAAGRMLQWAIAPGKRRFVKRHSFSGMKAELQFTLRELRTNLRPGQQALGLVAAVAVLAYLGPFDTWGALSVPDRIAFWTLATGVNWLFGMFTGYVAGRAFEKRGWPAWAGLVAGGSAIAAVPGTGVVWLLVAGYMGYRMASLNEIAALYAQVIGIHLILNVIVTLFIVRRRRSSGEEEVESYPSRASGELPGAAFLERIPIRLGRNLLHLHMQDHYVEVHTEQGSDLVLLRFRDALREVAALDGAQVHRSHWVARSAVAGVVRRRGRIALRLVNGTEVPVSRSFVPGLRERGWI